jgi:hypothetical protein
VTGHKLDHPTETGELKVTKMMDSSKKARESSNEQGNEEPDLRHYINFLHVLQLFGCGAPAQPTSGSAQFFYK